MNHLRLVECQVDTVADMETGKAIADMRGTLRRRGGTAALWKLTGESKAYTDRKRLEQAHALGLIATTATPRMPTGCSSHVPTCMLVQSCSKGVYLAGGVYLDYGPGSRSHLLQNMWICRVPLVLPCMACPA